MLLAAAAALSVTGPARADTYPNRPIRIVVGFPAGGGADAIARLLADHMSRSLKQAVIVENRPGAFTTLAPSFVASAPADGYTLLLGPDSVLGTDKLLFPSTVKYDVTNFTPINRIASTYFVLAANKDAGINSFADVLAKAPPQGLLLASPGGPYLQVILSEVRRQSKANLVEVPYRGGSPGALAVMSGEVQLTLMGPGALLPLVRENKIVAVATTHERASDLTPGVPPLATEGMPGFHMNFWYGLMAPAGLPDDVARRLFEASSAAVADPAVRQRLAALGYETLSAPSLEEARAVSLLESQKLKARVQAAGIKPQ
jgi:tripartite-type tricarboxylate transporter receptor subunit TctC